LNASPGTNADAFLERHVEQRTRVDAARQRDPEVEPTLRVIPRARRCRELSRERTRPRSCFSAYISRRRPRLRVDAAAPVELEHMRFPRVPVDESIVCFAAAMRRTMSGRDHPTDAQSWQDVFENDPTDTTFARTASEWTGVRSWRGRRRQPVRIIVDDDRAAAPPRARRALASALGERLPGRVLEVRDNENIAGGCPRAGDPRGGLHVEALLVDGHLEHASAVIAERRERVRERGRFRHDDIASCGGRRDR